MNDEATKDDFYRLWASSANDLLNREILTPDDVVTCAMSIAAAVADRHLGSDGAADFIEARAAELAQHLRDEKPLLC